jgi:hypothetical protein
MYHLLNTLGFTGEEGDRIIQRHRDVPLFMCGQNTYAIADVCFPPEHRDGAPSSEGRLQAWQLPVSLHPQAKWWINGR